MLNFIIPAVAAVAGYMFGRTTSVHTGANPRYARQRMPNFRPMPRGEALVEDAPYGQLGQFKQYGQHYDLDIDQPGVPIIGTQKFGLARNVYRRPYASQQEAMGSARYPGQRPSDY